MPTGYIDAAPSPPTSPASIGMLRPTIESNMVGDAELPMQEAAASSSRTARFNELSSSTSPLRAMPLSNAAGHSFNSTSESGRLSSPMPWGLPTERATDGHCSPVVAADLAGPILTDAHWSLDSIMYDSMQRQHFSCGSSPSQEPYGNDVEETPVRSCSLDAGTPTRLSPFYPDALFGSTDEFRYYQLCRFADYLPPPLLGDGAC